MNKCYLKGLQMTNAGSDVIVTGEDYEGENFGGRFPKDIVKDGKLEVKVSGGFKSDGETIMNINPVEGRFDREYPVSVRKSDLDFGQSQSHDVPSLE